MLFDSLLHICGNRGGKHWQYFLLQCFFPGHSVSSRIDLLLMLLVDVASLLSHAWWYKMVFLSQLSLCSNFGWQILVRQDHCPSDQGLVMVRGWGENKCTVLLCILLCSVLLNCGSYYECPIPICRTSQDLAWPRNCITSDGQLKSDTASAVLQTESCRHCSGVSVHGRINSVSLINSFDNIGFVLFTFYWSELSARWFYSRWVMVTGR